MYRSNQRPPSGGFTFQEMLIGLTVAGILAVGTVGARGIVQENRMRSELSQLLTHLGFARSEAIKRGAPVTLCTSSDGASCSASAGWRDGWILFADDDGDHGRGTDEALLRVQERLAADLTVRYGETGGYRYLTYKPDGSAWPQATFTFCDARGAPKAKAVIVFRTGRVRTATRKSDGPLQCP